ncbi:uncharacterized protein LOC131941961 [Physella acuta]|uniref:uncharacterized protein LOC131941961 n=1 Tax=Physella acuta TaxID=109671 RepID=UPI0027DCE2A3|nr:uncharacterized protein LOC131941961 [Physella acuta]
MMEAKDPVDVVVKKEPTDSPNGEQEEAAINQVTMDTPIPGQLRYVSRRGRPPGGGYSMKSHNHYFDTSTSELSRQAGLASGSALSPSDVLKSVSGNAEALDIRRFGFQNFDGDKSSFRCDGCDVVFSSRDTYAMHMLLRAKNESCVALPTSAISSNPENPTPREKFERELRQQAMISALRNQAAAMAAASILPKASPVSGALSPLAATPAKEDVDSLSAAERALNFGSLFSFDTYGVYVDPRQYRRLLAEYGLRTSSSIVAMMEHLSCSVCGELFSNKDALAMHMMYHTREEELKPPVVWGDVSNGANTSPTLPSRHGAPTTPGSDKRENSPQERELTAERVAELKRLAIESSLRSPCKKLNSVRSSSRPKSVSQDMAVTSSAQTRPMSADDVMLFAKSGFKDKQKSQNFFKSYEELYYRKRPLSKADNDNKRSEEDLVSKSKQLRRENDLYDFYSLQYRLKSSQLSAAAAAGAKLCDNHVSSATGPQDSDETSDTSSLNDQDTGAGNPHTRAEQPLNFGGSRSFPYLDAIMAQDAVLVPLETLDIDTDADKNQESNNLEESTASKSGSKTVENSALDFSISGRKRSESLGRSSWYAAPNNSDDETASCPPGEIRQDKDFNKLGGASVQTSFRRELYLQNPEVGQVDASSRAHLPGISATTSRPSKPGHDSERSLRGLQADSIGRMGEARYCPHCEILFLDVTLFHLHMGLHNVNNPWQCNTCGLVCSGRLEFNTHVLHY